jgi:hypothetical protein
MIILVVGFLLRRGRFHLGLATTARDLWLRAAASDGRSGMLFS